MTRGFIIGKITEGKFMASTEDKFISAGFMIFMVGMVALYGCSVMPTKAEDAVLHKTITDMQLRMDGQDKKIADLQVAFHNLQLEVEMTRKRGNGVSLGLGRVTKRINKVEEKQRNAEQK